MSSALALGPGGRSELTQRTPRARRGGLRTRRESRGEDQEPEGGGTSLTSLLRRAEPEVLNPTGVVSEASLAFLEDPEAGVQSGRQASSEPLLFRPLGAPELGVAAGSPSLGSGSNLPRRANPNRSGRHLSAFLTTAASAEHDMFDFGRLRSCALLGPLTAWFQPGQLVMSGAE